MNELMLEVIPDNKDKQAYNTMTSLLNDAFQSCAKQAEGIIDKANARKYYKTNDLPQGILTPEYLSNEFINIIPEANKDKVKAIFKNMLIVSWCLVINRDPFELRIPKIGSPFDERWMELDSSVARKAHLPNKKITAVCRPSLWLRNDCSVKAIVLIE